MDKIGPEQLWPDNFKVVRRSSIINQARDGKEVFVYLDRGEDSRLRVTTWYSLSLHPIAVQFFPLKYKEVDIHSFIRDSLKSLVTEGKIKEINSKVGPALTAVLRQSTEKNFIIQ